MCNHPITRMVDAIFNNNNNDDNNNRFRIIDPPRGPDFSVCDLKRLFRHFVPATMDVHDDNLSCVGRSRAHDSPIKQSNLEDLYSHTARAAITLSLVARIGLH